MNQPRIHSKEVERVPVWVFLDAFQLGHKGGLGMKLSGTGPTWQM